MELQLFSYEQSLAYNLASAKEMVQSSNVILSILNF